MRFKNILASGAAAFLIASVPASATTINLIDLGGVKGSQAEQGFKIAASYWGSMFTNNAVINLGVGFAPLATGIIGSTGSTRVDYGVAQWESQVNATKSGSTIDKNIVLPSLNNGGASFITNGTTTTNGKTNDDASKLAYNPGATASSQTLYMNTSVVKAIGGDTGLAAGTRDGNVTFSSNFNFDFNPTDGISDNTFDFIGVAIHEIGHALGFVSGVDFLDVYALGKGPSAGTLGYSLNDTSIYSALDMFRYSTDPTNVVLGTKPVLDLSVGGTKYFSVDGGKTALFNNTFSTGRYNGDGQQASHWKDTPGCAVGNGIMDPTFCYSQTGAVTGLDLAAFDAMGWNLSVDALSYKTTSTAQIYSMFAASVPEPATWGMMLVGFGLVGGTMRRRAPKVRYAV
ncbi:MULTISPECIES: NF038122 family metalloprotease [unclassified Sphingomonas]|uniref:NF038122 family metalloprotease n=1 Tax=unclassified Sphingomonas TaxID=196159 RepID=UPI001F578F68|nr:MULTISPECIES: NF038122 family metalloprotease [unclassified Sphingomonas]